MQGFVNRVADRADAELMLAGPDDEFVADDPEGSAVLTELCAALAALPERIRRRIHIASLRLGDSDENAVIVRTHSHRGHVEIPAHGGCGGRRYPGAGHQ